MDGAPPDEVCTDDVAACGAKGLVTTERLSDGLNQADVKDALEKAKTSDTPPLYGFDMRPTDGSVLQVTVDGVTFLVGSDCGDEPGCTPIPQGLAYLGVALNGIEDDVRGEAACAATLTEPSSPG